ncbi:MAG: plastocyanin/azurin family copper-binding protein [Solirubrobacteraceae bacterium]
MLKSVLRGKRLRLIVALTVALIACSSVAAFAFSGPVKVKDDYFSPRTLTVSRGAKVTWSWAGVLLHNVTVQSGPVKFHSRTQDKGSFSHVFTKPGVYHLECTIHPHMKMTITVR